MLSDNLAERISELVNKKSYGPEDDLKEVIDDLVRDIAIHEPNPIDWRGWVSYMLEQLEGEAQKRVRIGDFEKMLRTLADELVDRVDSGKW